MWTALFAWENPTITRVIQMYQELSAFLKIVANPRTDLAFAAMNEALDRPPLMFLDLRPFGPPMVIVRSYEIAEQICRPFSGFPYGLAKMPSVYGHMENVTGPTSILPASVSVRDTRQTM